MGFFVLVELRSKECWPGKQNVVSYTNPWKECSLYNANQSDWSYWKNFPGRYLLHRYLAQNITCILKRGELFWRRDQLNVFEKRFTSPMQSLLINNTFVYLGKEFTLKAKILTIEISGELVCLSCKYIAMWGWISRFKILMM